MINEDYVLETFKKGDINIEVKVDYNAKTIWLSQKDMGLLFNVSSDNIGLHIKNMSSSLFINEAINHPITENYSVVQTEGNRTVTRKIKHYNLDVILAIGYKCNPEITSTFKAWVDDLFNNSSQTNNKEKWLNKANSYEIVKFIDGDLSLDVNVSPDEDTIWLTQNDLALLFMTSKQNISFHINNIFESEELEKDSSVKEYLTVATNGKNYKITYYNLEVVTSVGYRVNTKRGIEFRKWANSILNRYLMKGYSINAKRCLEHSDILLKLLDDFKKLNEKLEKIENTLYGDNEQLIYEGDLIKPFEFLRKLFFLAKKEIIIIDNYADKFILSLLSDIKVKVKIICDNNSYLNSFNINDNIKIIRLNEIHDRYIIIDDNVYAIGTSINSIGKSRFTIIRLHIITKEMIIKKIEQN